MEDPHIGLIVRAQRPASAVQWRRAATGASTSVRRIRAYRLTKSNPVLPARRPADSVGDPPARAVTRDPDRGRSGTRARARASSAAGPARRTRSRVDLDDRRSAPAELSRDPQPTTPCRRRRPPARRRGPGRSSARSAALADVVGAGSPGSPEPPPRRWPTRPRGSSSTSSRVGRRTRQPVGRVHRSIQASARPAVAPFPGFRPQRSSGSSAGAARCSASMLSSRPTSSRPLDRVEHPERLTGYPVRHRLRPVRGGAPAGRAAGTAAASRTRPRRPRRPARRMIASSGLSPAARTASRCPPERCSRSRCSSTAAGRAPSASCGTGIARQAANSGIPAGVGGRAPPVRAASTTRRSPPNCAQVFHAPPAALGEALGGHLGRRHDPAGRLPAVVDRLRRDEAERGRHGVGADVAQGAAPPGDVERPTGQGVSSRARRRVLGHSVNASPRSSTTGLLAAATCSGVIRAPPSGSPTRRPRCPDPGSLAVDGPHTRRRPSMVSLPRHRPRPQPRPPRPAPRRPPPPHRPAAEPR